MGAEIKYKTPTPKNFTGRKKKHKKATEFFFSMTMLENLSRLDTKHVSNTNLPRNIRSHLIFKGAPDQIIKGI